VRPAAAHAAQKWAHARVGTPKMTGFREVDKSHIIKTPFFSNLLDVDRQTRS
jgi:hypothetical protein